MRARDCPFCGHKVCVSALVGRDETLTLAGHNAFSI
jgi:hypothetical protein